MVEVREKLDSPPAPPGVALKSDGESAPELVAREPHREGE
jgi:hypothetical protein